MTRVVLLSRSDWGARTDLPRRGHLIGPTRRIEVFIHHTTIVDSDATKNEWDDLGQVKAAMRVLQVIREKDLGADVPYSMVAFCMANGDLVLCEGRGLERTGAHTEGHNRSALGIAFQGNFESHTLPQQFDTQLTALGGWLADLRDHQGFVNLGASRPDDRQVRAHRDVKATLCPGQALFNRLRLIRFISEEEEDEMPMDLATWKKVQTALQAQDPPLYAGRPIDGLPGKNTNIAVRAFERRVELESRGVLGELDDPKSGIWPATRELLFATAFAPV